MSDSKVKTKSIRIVSNPSDIILVIVIIVALHLGMSNQILGEARSVPYDEGESDDLPSAAARLGNVRCNRVHGGCAYTFDVEVFESCWRPVYAVEIVGLQDAYVEPISWPKGWLAGTAPASLSEPGSMVFYTVGDPILPGAARSGFGLVCYSGSLTLRWFPADQDGILIGKASRVDLSCPVTTEKESWGSIKAVYR
jgi:hypothetical protein